MENIFGKNWKTLLSGFVIAILAILLPILLVNRWPTPIEIAYACGFALQGLFAKDSTTTGVGSAARTESDLKH